MKKKYIEPEMEITQFSVEDLITTSGTLDEDELPLVPAG